jgi:uncharacterized repeat protein (TIGR03803 family)
MAKTVQSSGMRLRAIALALAISLVPATVATQAQTFTVLYSLTGGTDGGTSYGGLIRDRAGNLYGTTYYGGTGGCYDGFAYGCGTVFKVDPSGTETVLHSFTATGKDGAYPLAGLVADSAGNLYGTTSTGGDNYAGIVFKLNKTGEETVLWGFSDATDGGYPAAGLIRDASGNLYGTAEGGGVYDYGVVFKLDKGGHETVLYSFSGTGGDAQAPIAGLVRDAAGNLYGTTPFGGASDMGAVFKLDKKGKEIVLYSFSGGTDGKYPQDSLALDAEGNLYGTALLGGRSYGVVFKVDKNGEETVLHDFDLSDGSLPSANLVRDGSGNLYGTATYGGAGKVGTVFKTARTGKVTVLHSFSYETEGGNPVAGLFRDAQGNLYGSTPEYGPWGFGTVFKLTP